MSTLAGLPLTFAAMVVAAAPLPAFSAAVPADAAPPRFSSAVENFVEHFKAENNDLSGKIVPLSPEESLKKLRPAPGYELELVAGEPVIRQPIDLHFDARGRLWVVQYIQYPFPAGLTITGYDQYMRAEFDRVPPPPPHHFKGADKITILEDRDGDGRYESHKTFVEGLNMATSIELGDGGVWVLQSPYLLFYPDKNGDDIPDGDPEVHLSGFGLEDTHSLASSLHWGPDGWLYGAKGSTTTLDIQGIRLLGQGIWRYHPGTKKFEIFAEGGGNTFSFEFDRYGRAYSGTNYGDTRGLHYVQGATYTKTWSKHGPALNPFIFGFFEHMAHEGYGVRFAQAFLYYEGGLLSAIDGQIVAGMARTNRVQASRVFPDTSTFRTVDSVTLVTSEDLAFRPVDVETGPDGCIYIADWYDPRIGHVDPIDNWDKSNGRIFRLQPAGFTRHPASFDLRQLPTSELFKLLTHANRWYREQARRLLAQRPEPMAAALKALIERETGDAALEALWILNLRGELDAGFSRRTLRHASEHVRRWTVRLWGDQGSMPPALQADCAALARTESAVEVRSQLASTARRLPAGQAFPIIRGLLARDEDATDKHLPLLIWWAIESQADTGREELLAMLGDPEVWKTKIFSGYIAERLGRRYTADQGPRKYYTLKQGSYSDWQIERAPEYLSRNLGLCARLLAAAPDARSRDLLVAGMAAGLTGRTVEDVPAAMKATVDELWKSRPRTVPWVTLAARLGQPEAFPFAVAMAREGKLTAGERQQLTGLFAATGSPQALPLVAGWLRQEKDDRRRGELLQALAAFEGPEAAEAMIDLFPGLSLRLRIVAQRLLSEKADRALVMLKRIEQGTFDPGPLSEASLDAIRAYPNPEIAALLERYRHRKTEDAGERRVLALFEQGKLVYSRICSACHQPDGQGHPGLAPSLVASKWIQGDEEILARIVLNGKESPRRGLVMPSLRFLDDGQIAAALVYVRRELGNQPAAIVPERVAAVRAATADRQKPWSDEELAQVKP